MKPASEPMTLEDVEALLAQASRLTNHRRFVIAGSLAATGAVVKPPRAMVMSRDLDFYPQLDPERGFEEIARQLGEGSVFHGVNGFYADPISPKILALPGGWETRLAPISLAGGVVAFFVDPNDIAISKMVRGNDNNLRWVRAGLAEGILSLEVMRARLSDVRRAEASEVEAVRTTLDDLEQDARRTDDHGLEP